MAVENVELVHECSPEHLRMRTARINEDKEIQDCNHRYTLWFTEKSTADSKDNTGLEGLYKDLVFLSHGLAAVQG